MYELFQKYFKFNFQQRTVSTFLIFFPLANTKTTELILFKLVQ